MKSCGIHLGGIFIENTEDILEVYRRISQGEWVKPSYGTLGRHCRSDVNIIKPHWSKWRQYIGVVTTRLWQEQDEPIKGLTGLYGDAMKRPFRGPKIICEMNSYILHIYIWRLQCQKQVSQAGISNCIPHIHLKTLAPETCISGRYGQLYPQYSVICKYLSCLRYLFRAPQSPYNLNHEIDIYFRCACFLWLHGDFVVVSDYLALWFKVAFITMTL